MDSYGYPKTAISRLNGVFKREQLNELEDVTMTHSGGDNLEYEFKNFAWSGYGEADKVWTIIRESGRFKTISLMGRPSNLPYTVQVGGRGLALSVTIPHLEVWELLVVELEV